MARSANASIRKIKSTSRSLRKPDAQRRYVASRCKREAYRATFWVDHPSAVDLAAIQALTGENKQGLFRRLVHEEAARVLLGQVRKALPELSQPEEPDSGG